VPEQVTVSSSRSSANTEDGDYEIIVTRAHGMEFLFGKPAWYYDGALYFRSADGKLHRTEVRWHTLKLRKKFWCMPDDAKRDSAAKAAVYKRYVPALKLYQEFRRQTGKRYEMERALNRGLPILPRIMPNDV
jgi:hypothetical protein